MKQRWESCRRLVALAVIVFGGWVLGASTPVTGRGAGSLWLADRGGNEVLQLDAGLAKQLRIPIERPIRVAPDGDGEHVWIVRATQGYAFGAHEIRTYRADGSVAHRHAADPVWDLSVGQGLAAWVTRDLGAEPRVFIGKTSGAKAEVSTDVAPRCLAVNDAGTQLILAGRAGALEVFSLTSLERLAVAQIDAAQLDDVVAGPAGGWFALDVVGGRVHALDAQLATRWVADTGLSPANLTTSTDLERVWVVDTNEPFVRRLSPNGAVELTVPDLPLGGFDRSVPTPQGGLLLIAPGAVLELDAGGTLVHSQGGFRFLSDIAR